MSGVGWGESAKLSGVEVTEGFDDAQQVTVFSFLKPENVQSALDHMAKDTFIRPRILPGGCKYETVNVGDRTEMVSKFFDNDAGNPDGGVTSAPGLLISWQRGPMVIEGAFRVGQNGAFVEDVIKAAKNRLEYFQASQFECPENMVAITHLEAALRALKERTAAREQRGVEGTHSV